MIRRLLQELMLRPCIIDRRDSINIVNLVDNSEVNTRDFVVMVDRAMLLIMQASPSRYSRLVRHIRYIANMPTFNHSTSYSHSTRCIYIDFEQYYMINASDPAYEWYLAHFATTLVYRATYSRMRSLGIKRTDEAWSRAARICHIECLRFIKRLHSENYDLTELARSFEPAKCPVSRRSDILQFIRWAIMHRK